MGVPGLREVCTQWCKSQDLPFVNEMTNIIKELHRCRDVDLSLRNMRKRTDITESPEKNEPPEQESRRCGCAHTHTRAHTCAHAVTHPHHVPTHGTRARARAHTHTVHTRVRLVGRVRVQ